jgi:hypothetical protein
MRVEWNEIRGSDTVFVIAEYSMEGWTFFERSTWEVAWSRAAASADRVIRAEFESKNRCAGVLPVCR